MKWIIFLVLFASLVGCIQNPPITESQPVVDDRPSQSKPVETKPAVDSNFAQRFNDVAKIFTDKGARVDAWDPSAPYTMRVYLPSSVAVDMTQVQARELAGMARTRLHDDAIVYIKSEGGQTIAKATPWGFE